MKIASIDIGTNTVIMLVAEVFPGIKEIKTIKNYYSIPRIGKNLQMTQLISDLKIHELVSILIDFKTKAINSGCEKILINATAALRNAKNSESIIFLIKSVVGLEVNVICGLDEAKFAFLGANLLSPEEVVAVIDIGGGSSEVIIGKGDKLLSLFSYEFGVVKLTEKYLISDPPRINEINGLEEAIISALKEYKFNKYAPLHGIAIAGTPTTLSAIKRKLYRFDEDLIDGDVLTLEELFEFKLLLSKLKKKDLKERYGEIIKSREDLLLCGTIILYNIVKYLALNKVIVSTKGIRYGAIADYLTMISDKCSG